MTYRAIQIFYFFMLSFDLLCILVFCPICWHTILILYYNPYYFHKVSSNILSCISDVIGRGKVFFLLFVSLSKVLSILLIFLKEPTLVYVNFTLLTFCSSFIYPCYYLHYFLPSASIGFS